MVHCEFPNPLRQRALPKAEGGREELKVWKITVVFPGTGAIFLFNEEKSFRFLL